MINAILFGFAVEYEVFGEWTNANIHDDSPDTLLRLWFPKKETKRPLLSYKDSCQTLLSFIIHVETCKLIEHFGVHM